MRWEWGSGVEADFKKNCHELAWKLGIEVEQDGNDIFQIHEDGSRTKLNDDFRPNRPWWRAYVALRDIEDGSEANIGS